MNYKMQGAIKRNQKNFIIFAILWVVLSIVFVMPMAYSIKNATVNGVFQLEMFLNTIVNSILNLGTVIGKTFTSAYIGNFGSILLKFTVVYAICMVIGIIKSVPKNEYTDIEHGSSDWCRNGEQYKILNNKKGIILAKENYLPIDKRGNVNVLVVGRIRIW